MAPKKTDNNSTSAPKKVGRKRVVKEKTTLKTPTVIKVTIPHVESKGNAAPKLTKRQLLVRRKIELANEVARAQLVKDKPVLESKDDVQKGRGRQKKISEFFNEDVSTENEDVVVQSLKKKGRQTKNTEAVKKGPTKRSADSTVKKPKKIETKKVTKTPNNNNIKATKEVICNGTHNLRKKKTAGNVLKDAQILSSLGTLLEQKLAESNISNDTPVPLLTLEEKCVESKSNCKTMCRTAGPVGSRKASVTSSCSALSWTRDISTSSTTTCVTVLSNDIVCFDRKIPILLLKDIKVEQNKKSDIPSSSSGSSSSCSESTPEDIPGMDHLNTLNLSTSSLSPAKSHYDDNIDKIGKALDKLSSKLKNVDLEIISWIGYENEAITSEVRKEVKKFEDSIFKVLKHENDVISCCQKLKRIVSNDTDNKVNDSETYTEEANKDEIDFVKPVGHAGGRKLSQDKFTLNRMFGCKENDTQTLTKAPSANNDYSPKLTSDDAQNPQLDQDYDDDDALSLFAESITGIESSRIQSSAPSVSNVCESRDLEEYVPKPIKEVLKSPESYTYNPTRIEDTNDQTVQSNKTKTVCEKQSADSTSIVRQFEKTNSEPPETSDDASKKNDEINVSVINLQSPAANMKVPSLMASRFKSINGVKSVIFRGYCFFFLISGCKNEVCHFRHSEPDITEIKNKLTKLSEVLFIQEYMLIRNWPNLRRKYGLAFVEECLNRNLSRILVEMTIDFIVKTNTSSREDATLKIEVIEITLMHLNSVDLRDFEDLLKYSITLRLFLCDVFMQAIADTQNFSRFKMVFMNITRFVIDNGRTFSLEVAERILERVCILPPEEPLARATIKILKHTDSSIFFNKMMGQFELQLINLKNELHREFLLVKKQASLSRPLLGSPYVLSPQLNLDIDPMSASNLVSMDREKRYTSPDTTNLDNLNNPVVEPVINRIIDVNRPRFSINIPQSFNIPQNFGVNLPQSFSNSNSPSPNHEDENIYQMHRKWQNKTVFGNIQKRTMARPLAGLIARPVMRPPLNKRHSQRQVTYGASPTKYRRGPGPDF